MVIYAPRRKSPVCLVRRFRTLLTMDNVVVRSVLIHVEWYYLSCAVEYYVWQAVLLWLVNISFEDKTRTTDKTTLLLIAHVCSPLAI